MGWALLGEEAIFITRMKTVIAAYCFKGKGRKHRLIVVTSSTGRWIIPKGQVKTNLRNREVALEEAWEETGVRGEIVGKAQKFVVNWGGMAEWKVFPVEIKEIADLWPEKKSRTRRLVRIDEALSLIDNAGLVRVVKELAKNHQKD